MKLIQEIDSYIQAMHDIHVSINHLQGEKFLKNHKITLTFSLIETISSGVYGELYLSNSKRFQHFIKEFCEWEDANRVSLQQLAFLLEKTEDDEFQELKEHVSSQVKKYPPSSAVPFSYDSTIEEIKELMPNGHTKINGVDINRITHGSLMWKYRNSLVHEARSIGSQELFASEHPHYVHFTVFEEECEWKVWRICYPIEFFNNLVEIALRNVREHLIENERDPRKNYDFGELWIKPRQ